MVSIINKISIIFGFNACDREQPLLAQMLTCNPLLTSCWQVLNATNNTSMCTTIPYKKICKVLKQETTIFFLIYHFDKFQNHEEPKQECYKANRKHVFRITHKRFADKRIENRKHRYEIRTKTFRGSARQQITNTVPKPVSINRFSTRFEL